MNWRPMIVGIIGCGLALAATAPLARAAGECGYYTNSAGHQVPRPCEPNKDKCNIQCQDGTVSCSEHPDAPGTCSHHGGRR